MSDMPVMRSTSVEETSKFRILLAALGDRFGEAVAVCGDVQRVAFAVYGVRGGDLIEVSELEAIAKGLKDHHKDRVQPVDMSMAPSYILASNEGEENEPDADVASMIIAEMETKIPALSVGEAVMQMEIAGAPLLARYSGHRAGHAMTNALLRTLFARPEAFRMIVTDPGEEMDVTLRYGVQDYIEGIEKKMLEDALKKARYNKTRAA